MNTGIVDSRTMRGYMRQEYMVITPVEVYRYYSQIYISVYRVVCVSVYNPTRSRDWKY